MTRIGFSGHQNLPPDSVPGIVADLRRHLERAPGPVAGITCLAEGADQRFAELIGSTGGRLEVIVPCAGYESTFADATRYRDLLATAAGIRRLDFPAPSDDAFLEAGKLLVADSDELLAVWDGLPARGRGGTADIVAHARTLGRPVTIIWPPDTHR